MTTPFDIENANITWQQDGAPYSADYDDVYFSRQGGMAETDHVFLSANALQERWLAADQRAEPGVFSIVELGFGTGLNFLRCWRLWQQTGCQRLRLHFISCEKHPLRQAALQQALLQWPELADLGSRLLAQYPEHSGGYHRLLLRGGNNQDHRVLLDLYYGDALTMLQQQCSPDVRVDAWFLDGFIPDHNPDMWSQDILTTIASMSRPDTTLSSYSVTGRVVRALRELNFDVEKRKGFGPKRLMLFARKSADNHEIGRQRQQRQQRQESQESQENQENQQRGQHAVVIGAGLAGATAARALAERGVNVTVLEQLSDIAQGASGNSQAVVQMRLNKQADTQWQFHLHSYLYALRFYDDLASVSDNAIDWHSCGVLTLDSAYTNTRHHTGKHTPADARAYSHYPSQLLHRVSADQTQAICGISLPEGGNLQPRGGWLNPAATCHACLDHHLITVLSDVAVAAIEHSNGRWQTYNSQHQQLSDSNILVIANSYAAREFSQTALYPVSPLRGQITEVPASDKSQSLNMVVCSERYLAPKGRNGKHCIGASYVKGAVDTDMTTEEQDENLQKSAAVRAQLQLQTPAKLSGRASIRGSSGDYMPIAGSVPDPTQRETRYGNSPYPAPRETGASLADPEALPGLFISTGHGSHGTVSCPILAEHIACLAVAEASPLPAPLAECIAPMRFIRRQRRRQQKPARR